MFKFTKFTNFMKSCESDLESNGIKLHSYSGRAMYGNECIAMSGGKEEIKAAIASLICSRISVLQTSPNPQEFDDTREFVTLIQEFKSDSLGNGLVLYWPSIPYEE